MDKPISFRVCDFSEQIAQPADYGEHHATYSAIAHIDGQVFQFRYAINPQFSPPLSTLRSRAWLALLEDYAESRT